MGDLSPVLASFLAGYQAQTGLNESANSIKQRKLQLDQMIKEFDANMKMKEAEHSLHQQTVDFNRKKAIEDLKKDWITNFMKNPESAPGTTPMAVPGMQRVETMGSDNLPQLSMQPALDQVMQPPKPGSPITMDSEFGPITIPMPQSEMDQDLQKEQKLLTLRFPFQKRLYKETVGDENTKKLESQVSQLQTKLDTQKEIWDSREKMMRDLADLRAKSAAELAEIRAGAAMQHMLFNMGFADPSNMKTTILQYARDRSTGKMDASSLKGQPLNNLVEKTMREMGVNDLPGGSKTRQNVTGMGSLGSDLILKFDQLNNAYPAANDLKGKAFQFIRGGVPGIRNFTDIGMKYKELDSNLMNFVKTSSNVTSSRLIDSNKEQARFKGSLPEPTDSVISRNDKRWNLIGNVMDHIQANIGGLSQETRKDFWTDIFREDPTWIELGKDPRVRELMKKTVESGNFSLSYVTPYLQNKENK